jgi:hypothetical protein
LIKSQWQLAQSEPAIAIEEGGRGDGDEGETEVGDNGLLLWMVIESGEEVEFVVPLGTTGGIPGSGRRSDLEGGFRYPLFGASVVVTLPTA